MMARIPPRWYLVSLRPQGRHEALRKAAARHGGGLVALSSCRLLPRDDDATRQALDAALATGLAVFTSPAAVHAADALRPLRGIDGVHWLAVGAGTAAALRRAGVAGVAHPARMDSEGLLALPALQDVVGKAVGLVTAPGGRGLLQPALQARGAHVVRADVYTRAPMPVPAHAVARLCAIDVPLALALSSREALAQVLAQLPVDAAACLRRARVAAASERLAATAREHGFGDIAVAAGPRPAQLVAAICSGHRR